MSISAVIITFNEERNISRCLESLIGVADEILVVDSFSTDQTKDICLSKRVSFIENTFEGHIEQKNFGMKQAKHDYVLSLDADEMLSEELRKSILDLKDKLNQNQAYNFNRLNNYCGQWIKYCGWYPDRKIRLWDRRVGKWGGTNPHDKVVLEKGTKQLHLKGDLLHYSYTSIDQHKAQIEKFSTISAQAAHAQSKSAGWIRVAFSPIWKFIKDYIFRLGFLEGKNGFFICWLGAKGKYLKYKKLKSLG